jgi:hypothetical protein
VQTRQTAQVAVRLARRPLGRARSKLFLAAGGKRQRRPSLVGRRTQDGQDSLSRLAIFASRAKNAPRFGPVRRRTRASKKPRFAGQQSRRGWPSSPPRAPSSAFRLPNCASIVGHVGQVGGISRPGAEGRVGHLRRRRAGGAAPPLRSRTRQPPTRRPQTPRPVAIGS